MPAWIALTEENQLAEIVAASAQHSVAIFKHSTRCSISSMAKSRLERNWSIPDDVLKVYFLDLIQYRSISDAISKLFDVRHESPQVLIIKNGKAVYDASHHMITAEAIAEEIS